MLFLVIFSAFQGVEGNTDDEKSMNIAMRMLGHQLLINSGDSSTRVLPVQRFVNAYHISFDGELAIVPDSLLSIANRLALQSQIPSEYILEVVTCDSNKVVYAYQIGEEASNTIIPCKGRDLPKACYTIVLTDLTAAKQDVVVKEEKSNWLGLLFSGMAILLSVLAIYWYRKNQKKRLPNPNLIAIGKYHFDKLNSELIIKEQRIELTSKEADLLMLLYQTANVTVERDVILNKVWGDEGDYIGRTLDVFISKLRKKLEFDTSVKIVNVRGVGYKLVLAG